MKKVIVLIALLSLSMAATAVLAKTYNYPVEKPIFSIDFPDSWNVKYNTESVAILALSPDEEIEYDIWPLPARAVKADIKTALNAAVKEVNETIAEYVKNPDFTDWKSEKINGIEFLWAEGSGKDRETGERVDMEVDFFSPDDETIYVLMYWGSPEGGKKYKAEIEKIDHSIKRAK